MGPPHGDPGKLVPGTPPSWSNQDIPSILLAEHFIEFLYFCSNLFGLCTVKPFNVNINHFLDSLDPEASEIGAVNTIRFDTAGNRKILKGFNTDAYGFRRSLEEIVPKGFKLSKALILGTGGASKAVAYTLKQMNIEFEFVSSSAKSSLSYTSLNDKIISGCQLIVNTSPLGTFPNINECPAIPYEYLNSSHILFDLVYNPAQTLFLKNGSEMGALTLNGLKMLEYQASKSWEIWNMG